MAVGPPPEAGEQIVSEEQVSEDARRARKKPKSSHFSCEVSCLDGSLVKADIEKSAKGEVLFNQVIQELTITEREYVGLSFTNEKGMKLWLDIHKDMKHQIGERNDLNLQLRLKFYEPEPTRIQDVFLRYLFYLQMREDITEGRLRCHENTYAILGSYTAQAELGDFNLHTHDHDYLNEYQFAPADAANVGLVKRIHELHKEHRGQTSAQAEVNFLEVAKKIPKYGVDIHNGKDNEGDVEIGVAAIGVYIYRFEQKEYLFRWQVVDAVLYNRRKYTVKLKESVAKAGEESAQEDAMKTKKKPQLTHVYYFDSATKCKQCYKSSVEYHTFFRLARPDAPRKKTDSLKIGSSFRYSDRTLYQLRHRPNAAEEIEPPSFVRTLSKRTNTPRGSWNPEDDHLKPAEEPQERDAKSPDDDRFSDLQIPDMEFGVKEEPIMVTEDAMQMEVAPVNFEEPEEPIPMYMEEVEIDETNPEDSWYDPTEWDVMERVMPDGTKKRYRVRMVPADEPPSDDSNLAIVTETQPMEMEEVEIDEDDPEDQRYDPKDWDIVEKQCPDGKKKRFRRRYIITSVKTVPKKHDNLLVSDAPIKIEEVPIDEAHPDEYDPAEWEVAEKLTPDGKKELVRRRIVFTRVVVLPKKPSDCPADETFATVEEVPFNKAEPDDQKYSPNEWEVAEKTLPDGTKKLVRRRVAINKIVYVSRKPSDIPLDEPMAVLEEVPIDKAHSEAFDPNQWEVVDTVSPDGTKKPVRRRVLLTRVEFVKKKPTDVTVNESLVAIEELDIDKAHPEDYKYNPAEWEVVPKTLPTGEVIPVRRRLEVTRVHVVYKKPSEVPPEEHLSDLEEVDYDEADSDQYNPNEWEVVEKTLPDGTTKKVRQRYIITHVEVLHKKAADVTLDEQPVAELQELPIDEANPEDDKYDPTEWEVVSKTLPDGRQTRVRRRYIIRRVHVAHKRPSDVTPDERRARVEEVEIDEAHPEDHKYDPSQWEIVEKTTPGCRGKVKRVRRRIVLTRVGIVHRRPCEIPDDDPLKKAIADDNLDPNDWEVARITLPDGEKKTGRRCYLIPEKSQVYTKPSNVPAGTTIAHVEEMEVIPQHIEDQKYDPSEWEVMEKTLPNGRTKPVRRRYLVKTRTIEYMKPCDVAADIPLCEVEEVPITKDETFDPAHWDVMDKLMPDGSKTKVRRRYIVTTRQISSKKPTVAVEEEPHVEIEEVELVRPDEKYDPSEWDVVEKVSPGGVSKKYRCRIKVTKVARVYFKPSAVSPDDEQGAEVEEVDMDDEHPENDKFDPSEWDIIDKPMPDGTTKRVRRRFVVTRVEIVLKKPSELTADEPEGVSVEEVDVDDTTPIPYDQNEWEVVEKICPDGTKKKVRRRIIVKCIKTHKKPVVVAPVAEIPIIIEEIQPQELFEINLFATPPAPRSGKKVIRRRSVKTTITPVGGRSVSVSTEEVPKQTEEIEIDESNPEDHKYNPSEWEVVEKVMPNGEVRRFRHRIVETVITTVNKKYSELMVDGSPVRMEEFEIDDTHPENEFLDPAECEILEKTLPDGSRKRFSRRIISSALPGSDKETDTPALWEEVEIDETNPDDQKFDADEWEVLEKTLPDGSKKRFRRRNLNVITVHKKPIAITAGDAPLRVQEVEIDEDVDQDINLDDWEVVEKTLPNGKKKKFHRKILTTIFSSLNEKNEMIENPPIHIEEVEIYEVSDDEDDKYNPVEWEVTDKILPDGRIAKTRSRSSTTVITPKDTMKLDDKTVEETPITAEEIELDEFSPNEHTFDPEEWDIIERKLPDGTTKRFHRRIIRKYKKISNEDATLIDEPIIHAYHPVEDTPIDMEEIELDESNPEELQKYNTPEWEIVEKTMPDGTVKRFRRKIITTVITTVTTKTIVVHPDGTEEVVDIETTPGEETTLESIEGGLETVPENLKKHLQPEEEPVSAPLLEANLESGIDFDMDNLLSEIDQISKSLSDDDARIDECQKVPADFAQEQEEEDKIKKLEAALCEEEIKFKEFEEEKLGHHLSDDEEAREQEQKDHSTAIDSIFDLDEDEFIIKGVDRECDDFEFASADIDFSEPKESEVIRTASVGNQPKLTQERRLSAEEDGKKVLSLDRRYLKRGETMPIRSHSALPDITTDDELPRCHSTAGIEQGDVYRPHEEGNSEILYTVRDVSEVEQGEGGFVQSIKARHEVLATEEAKDVQRNSAYYLDDVCAHPKGHVPTHTVNYHDVREPEVTLTKDPPAVAGRPTVIVPASSELPDEEITHTISQSPVESHPDLLTDVSSSVTIPEVKTQSVVFEEMVDDNPTYGRDPEVETRTVQIVPVTESYTMQHETIHDVARPPDIVESPNSPCQVTTSTMPTEVITKTITIEGDSSTMSLEELQDIIRRSGSDENILDDENVYSTQVVSTTTVQKVITGQTITVVGDDEEELQKAIDEAVKNATLHEEMDDDGTIVMTAVEQYDEDGNIIATDFLGPVGEATVEVDGVVEDGTEI